MFFGLSFLPPAEVGDAFIELLSIIPAENECIHFADYVLDTYIDENSEFPPHLWASSPIYDHPRTTNGPESSAVTYNIPLCDSLLNYHCNCMQVTTFSINTKHILSNR